MQQSGKEEPANLFPTLREIYKSKYEMATQGNRKKRKVFDMHDGKTDYTITQHSLWNRKHTPLLLYNCKRGDAVRNADEVCGLIDHDEFVELNKKSSK